MDAYAVVHERWSQQRLGDTYTPCVRYFTCRDTNYKEPTDCWCLSFERHSSMKLPKFRNGSKWIRNGSKWIRNGSKWIRNGSKWIRNPVPRATVRHPTTLPPRSTIDELREEVDVKESFKRTLVRSRLKWTGHVERMEEERLTKRAYMFIVEVEGKEEDHHRRHISSS